MNLAEQIARHQVDSVWMPNPQMHKTSWRDWSHYFWASEILAGFQRVRADKLKILDVGCYDGWLDFLLLEGRTGYHIDGLELIPNLCASARAYAEANKVENYRTIEGTLIGSHAYGGAKTRLDYDAVMCFEVLEHIPSEDVPNWLVAMEIRCKPGGLILLSLPDQKHEDNPQHLWTPTKPVIDELLKHKKGATVEYKSYPGTGIPGNFFIQYLA